MPLNRAERISLHKKQERLQVKTGAPSVSDLQEGVPVLRATTNGLAEYVRYNNKLYSSNYNAISTRGEVEGKHWIYDVYSAHSTTFDATTGFIPWSGQSMANQATLSTDGPYGLLAPYNGEVVRIIFRSNEVIADASTAVKFELYEAQDGTEDPTGSIGTFLNLVLDLGADDIHYVFDVRNHLTGSNAMAKGNLYQLKFTGPESDHGDLLVTTVVKWDINS